MNPEDSVSIVILLHNTCNPFFVDCWLPVR